MISILNEGAREKRYSAFRGLVQRPGNPRMVAGVLRVDLGQRPGLLVLEDPLRKPSGSEATRRINTGMMSSPFFVSAQRTRLGEWCSSTFRIMSASSSSLSRRASILGVNPGMVRRRALNRSARFHPISRMMSRLHFRPRTPKLVAIGQFLNGTTGTGGSTGMLAMGNRLDRWRGWDSARLKGHGRTPQTLRMMSAVSRV